MQERVACLILLDTPLPKRYWSLRFFLATLAAHVCAGISERIASDSIPRSVDLYSQSETALAGSA